jgi:subtilisin family serine protease
MKKILIFLTLLVLGIGIAYNFLDLSGPKTSTEVLTQESTGHAANFGDSDSPLSPPKATHASQSSPAHSIPNPAGQPVSRATRTLLEAVLNQPVSIEHGGALRELALAKDELYVRNSDGIGRVVSIPSADSASDLLAQIEKLQKETGSAPELILYPPGAARDDSTRRIVTRDILIEAESRSAADSLASASGLSFKSAPVYAKGKYIYEAPSSPEALAFFVKTADSASPYVTPLLASKVAKMAMPNDPLVQKQWHLKFQNQLGAVSGTDVNVESIWKYPKTKAFVYSGNATIDLTRATTDHIRGGNVTIGIVDDGMEWSHPDLLPNVLRNLQKDWNGKDNDPKPYLGDPTGQNNDNHGTACAGVAAACGNNRIGVSGVAPEANLVGMRLIAGPQTDADIAEAMTWYPDTIHIKSNSWGYYAFTTNPYTGLFEEWNEIVSPDPLTEAALEYAAKYGRGGKGSIITFAAGNHDEFRLTSNGSAQKSGARVDFQALPNSIYTIAVGAVNSLGKKSNYSQVGSSLLISAPSNTSDGTGLGIMTTDNKGPKGYNYGVHNPLFTWLPVDDFKGSGDVTQNFGGTSSATPAVSGVIALMLQRNPNLGWRDVQEILMRSAVKIDSNDSGWISRNGTDHATGNATTFKFNDKYGAGLVDAAAAVSLSGNWTKNLGPQLSLSTSNNTIQALAANSTVNRTLTVNGSITRAEHVTLQLTVTDIPKGNLTITLTSPGNTTSTFCIPHSDTLNKFENWKFMTVRSWAENPNGNWTLTVTNNGTTTGNLTKAELVVFGTATPAAASTSVTLAASTTLAPLSSNITLNATAVALGSNGTMTGNITGVQFFRTLNGTTILIGNGTLSSNSTNPAKYSLVWNTTNLTSGNYSITANATSSGNVTGISQSVIIKLDPVLVAGWDFQTLTSNRSSVPIATALMSVRTYNANFGNGNGALLLNGSNGSSQWSYANGETFVGPGSALNAGAGFSSLISNPAALLLRAGRNLSANGKSLIFRCNSTANKTYTISYAASSATGGFSTHAWSWSNNATGTFTPMGNATLTSNFTTSNFTTSNATSNGTLFLRLTPSGATSASGTNLIDNIQIQSN